MDSIKDKDGKETLTIHDVARELGVSASTVSRAISGKGRIGEETRQRVLQFINENSFHPNATARSLAQSRTYNIALVMPQVRDLVDMPFFHTCMHGAEEVAQSNDYDLLIVTTDGADVRPLERMVQNRKVDGIILTRTYEDDVFVKYLNSVGIPFVTIGQSSVSGVLQVDHDNTGGCKELVTVLFSKGMGRIAYLGGGLNQMVNKCRIDGFYKAHKAFGKEVDENIVYTNLQTKSQISKAVDELLKNQVDCMLCQDDYICDGVVRRLSERDIAIPSQMRVASCHYSRLLENYPVTITSLKFDTMDIGRLACQVLLDKIGGLNPQERTLLDYEINLKESTK